AVSSRLIPRSKALCTTLREASRSIRPPKLLQPSPTMVTCKPDFPRVRRCTYAPVASECPHRSTGAKAPECSAGCQLPTHTRYPNTNRCYRCFIFRLGAWSYCLSRGGCEDLTTFNACPAYEGAMPARRPGSKPSSIGLLNAQNRLVTLHR